MKKTLPAASSTRHQPSAATTIAAADRLVPGHNALRRRMLLGGGALLSCAGLLPSLAAGQQPWRPARPIRLLNGFSAGGAGDIVCRIIAESLKPVLKQTVVVDTRPGANGFIAAEAVSHANPDGLTVGMATMSMLTIAPQLPGMRTPINVQTGLTPIANIAGIYMLLVASPKAPFQTVPELIAYAKAHPGVITYASAGIGSAPHLAGELFRKQANIDIRHVPYRGGAQALVDLVAGRVDMIIGNMPDFLGQLKSGALRGIAFAGEHAAPALPNLPLIKQWLPNYNISNWFGIVGPGRLPPDITRAWNTALQDIMRDPTTQKRMTENGLEVLSGPTDSFIAQIAKDRERWGEVIKAAGIHVN